MSDPKIRERVKSIMAGVFGIPAARIPDDATIETLPEWDSLGHLEVMLALEMEYGVALPTETMIELVSLQAIATFLSAQAAAA
jgi:acyl carrier protein